MKGEIALKPCRSNRCQAAASGGRNQAEPNRELCSVCVGLIRKDLLNTANLWPDLEAALTASNQGMTEKVQTSGKPGISIDDNISRAISRNMSRIMHLANVAGMRVDREQLFAQRDDIAPALIRYIACRWKRLAYTTDADIAVNVADQAYLTHLDVYRTAHPERSKRVDIPRRCPVPDGRGRICGGHLYALVWPDRPASGAEIHCEADSSHDMDASQWWQRYRGTATVNRAGMTRLLYALDTT